VNRVEKIQWLVEHADDIVSGLLMILGGASILARLTPTKKDDKVLDAILKVIHTLGLTKKEAEKDDK